MACGHARRYRDTSAARDADLWCLRCERDAAWRELNRLESIPDDYADAILAEQIARWRSEINGLESRVARARIA